MPSGKACASPTATPSNWSPTSIAWSTRPRPRLHRHPRPGRPAGSHIPDPRGQWHAAWRTLPHHLVPGPEVHQRDGSPAQCPRPDPDYRARVQRHGLRRRRHPAGHECHPTKQSRSSSTATSTTTTCSTTSWRRLTPTWPEVDDAVMLDDRGFLAETNATNLFVVRESTC